MPVSHPKPDPQGDTRRTQANVRREAARVFAESYPNPLTQDKGDEAALETDGYAMSFTKGLCHGDNGIVDQNSHHSSLTEAINQEAPTDFSQFELAIDLDESRPVRTEFSGDAFDKEGIVPEWRGWESPRAGHYYSLEGPVSDALCMPPAPALNSVELEVEMAEVYALALLRDVPINDITSRVAATTPSDIAVDDKGNRPARADDTNPGVRRHADPHLLNDSQQLDPEQWHDDKNVLLPMAFAEGSPMHPSYGAGHATVAGGCVTFLKAFFHTVNDDVSATEWPEELKIFQVESNGEKLRDIRATDPDLAAQPMTIAGELNKLAANISIGRDMAGVHFYTDYYESLRMGERVATGILIEHRRPEPTDGVAISSAKSFPDWVIKEMNHKHCQ